MVTVRLSRLFVALATAFVCVSFLLASCATPEFKFVDTNGNKPSHCQNQQIDEGESDLDCGGVCMPCALKQHCNSASDCIEGDCIDGTCQAASCNDGNQSDNETDIDCGGGACKTCPVGGKCTMETDCQSGVCDGETCSAPTCGDRVQNGSESDIDCGGSDCPKCVDGQKCLIPSDCVGAVCNNLRCALTCVGNTANCDGNAMNACETNVKTDVDHCGDCDTACSLDKANPKCVGGECKVDTCVAPFEDCNGEPTDGCEVNTEKDPDHCGSCDESPCPSVNGTPHCVDAKCTITCDANFADCDGQAANGCEKDVSRDINNCGGCGKTCTASAGKTAWCRNGQCGETTCAAGRGDCNGDPDDDAANNGCETDLKTNPDSCGTCGNICVVAGGDPQCTAGVCAVKSCTTGLADCTGGYADGCETKTSTDSNNCGACGKTCTTANGSSTCVSGACQVKGCTGTYADCNNSNTDGCETNTASSQTHCGGCTGATVNCDTVFPHSGGQCTGGTCVLKPMSCATGFDNCNTLPSDGCESNLNTDTNNCSACKTVCSATGTTSAGTSCAAGVCSPVCKGTLLACGTPQNGCTIDSATDENNCGGCGKVCLNTAAAHVDSTSGGNQCLSGGCSPSCASLYKDCDSNPNNGCEKSVASDTANCGGCNVSCGTTNTTAAPTCSSGSCNFQCKSGYGACGAPSAGCATPLGTLANCTACGDACAANGFCTASGCATHFDIGVVGTPVSAIKGFESLTAVPTLTANHTLVNDKADGVSRIVLVAVTAIDPYINSEFVWYGGTLMHAAVETKTNEMPGSYAGIFYLLDSELPATGGTYQVKVQFSNSLQNGTGGFTVSEFQNVQQTPSPFVTTTAQSSDANCGTPSTRSVAFTFSQAGSFAYAVIGARQGTSATAVPGTVTETMNLYQNQPSPLAALAGYKGPIDSNSTLSWSMSNCPNNAGAGVVLKRLGD
ncbi:MAG TPA: hypothetical protein VER96_12015 [Polyangiaceae bacterium]|nr:hypothetical protein [Polyangiaceae bacterium]